MRKTGKGRRQRQKKEQKKKAVQSFTIEEKEITSLEDIAEVLEKIQFKRTFGGVDKQDVWEKIKALDGMYRKLYFIQEQRYSLIADRADTGSPGQKKQRRLYRQKQGGADHE